MTRRLAYFIESFYPKTGGSERRALSLLSRLKNTEVDVYTINFGNDREERRGNINIHRIVDMKKEEYFREGGRNLGMAMRYAFRSREVARENDHDIYVFDQFPYFHYSMSVKHIRGNTVLVQMHEVVRGYYRNAFMDYAVGIYEGRMARNSGGVIATSSVNASLISKTYGVDPGNISVLENGTERVGYSSNRDRRKVLFVGRNTQDKRISMLIELAGRMSEYRFVIVTDRDTFPNRPGNVEVKVGLNDDEIYREYSDSYVFATASYREGYSIASLEAMGFGVPVLYIRSPYNDGMKEIVRDGKTGFACSGLDEMEKRIREIDSQWDKMSREAYEFARERTWDSLALKYEDMLMRKMGDKR